MLETVVREPTGTGPLDGVRVAVKEIVALGGHPLTANTTVQLPGRWSRPDTDAPIVARLRSAGASVAGTTTTHEFAWGITGWERGRTVENPHQPGRVAGGSSGGSAVAVATGEVELAIGTDTAGSVRIPAAWCRVLGWKMSDGLVSMEGILPLAPGLDHPGLLAADPGILQRAALALGADPVATPLRARWTASVPGTPTDPRATTLVHRAVDALASAGHDRAGELTGLPDAGELMACFTVVQNAAALHAHRDLIGTWPSQRDRYPASIIERLEAAEGRTSVQVEGARRAQMELRKLLGQLTEDTVLVLPATGCGPPLISEPNVARIQGQPFDLRSVVLPNTVPANLAGLPAVTVPAPMDGEGFGVQLLGPAGSDHTLIELAGHVMAALGPPA